jgi:hypothetical protein
MTRRTENPSFYTYGIELKHIKEYFCWLITVPPPLWPRLKANLAEPSSPDDLDYFKEREQLRADAADAVKIAQAKMKLSGMTTNTNHPV